MRFHSLMAAITAVAIGVSCQKGKAAQTSVPQPGGNNASHPPATIDGGSVDCASMEKTARFAGFFAAHAIWSVSDGETLVTMVATESADGQRKLDRYAGDIKESVVQGREQLLKNPQHAARAALVFDGVIELPDGKTDVIYVEAREYGNGEARPFEIAVPYRSASAPGGFAVFRPKLRKVPLELKDCESLLTAFWAGVDTHTKAAEVWNAHIDQSR